MFDYIIVGQGLSGSLLVCELLKRNKHLCVIKDDNLVRSSNVAPGMFNPLVLKRFTLAWKSPELIKNLLAYYGELEERLDIKLIQEMELFRLFNDNKEISLWEEKSDSLALEPFMDSHIYPQSNEHIVKNFGLGKVKSTGRIILKSLMQGVSEHLDKSNALKVEKFDYSLLDITQDFVQYGELKAKNIIFAEGYLLKENPWFKYLPLKGTKGELITIHAPDLKLSDPIKSSVLVMPLGNDQYRVGASFNWDDKDCIPTEEGRNWLEDKLKQIINCNFEVIEHDAGIRPTVIDRRPLIGTHNTFKNLHVLNGMGTRGVMLAPKAVEMLINSIENNTPIENEWDIKRFDENA